MLKKWFYRLFPEKPKPRIPWEITLGDNDLLLLLTEASLSVEQTVRLREAWEGFLASGKKVAVLPHGVRPIVCHRGAKSGKQCSDTPSQREEV